MSACIVGCGSSGCAPGCICGPCQIEAFTASSDRSTRAAAREVSTERWLSAEIDRLFDPDGVYP